MPLSAHISNESETNRWSEKKRKAISEKKNAYFMCKSKFKRCRDVSRIPTWDDDKHQLADVSRARNNECDGNNRRRREQEEKTHSECNKSCFKGYVNSPNDFVWTQARALERDSNDRSPIKCQSQEIFISHKVNLTTTNKHQPSSTPRTGHNENKNNNRKLHVKDL